MREGWKKYKLGDLIDIKHGYAFKGECFSEQPTPDILLTPGNFKIGGGFKNEKFKYYKGEYPEDYILKAGDIVVTMTDLSKEGDTLGYSALVPNDAPNRFLHNQRIGLVQFKTDDCDKLFLYWLLRTKTYQTFIVNSATGSTVKHTSPTRIQEFEFEAPDLHSQRRIAAILSAMDEKIELTRQTNQTLEFISQALFKEWFVDFNFPDAVGEMQDSELGLIPVGWRVEQIANLFEVKDGTHDSPKQTDSNYYLITSKHLKNGVIDFNCAYKISDDDYHAINKRSKVEYLDILYSMIGTVGNILVVGQKNINFTIKNIGIFKTSQNTNLALYINSYLREIYSQTYFTERQSGSTQQYVTLRTLRELPVIVPDDIILNKFNNIAKPAFEVIQKNYNEIEALIQLRDNLLPKLMNGEIEA